MTYIDTWRHTYAHARAFYYLSGGKLVLAEYGSWQGGQQGGVQGTGWLLRGSGGSVSDQTLAAEGGYARATCDDLTLCEPTVLVWRTLANFKRDAFEQLGLFKFTD